MMETAVLTVVLLGAILFWRTAVKQARRAWSALVWWERVLLVACFAPIPGPLDELVGVWLVARGIRRLKQRVQ